jgi:PadR family transcriptional regulator, regulatory protein AphA
VELSKTAYVILGMLSLGRVTGYDIKSLVDVSTRFFWAASYGQIYPELAKLEELGLVRGERDDEDGRRRKRYRLTPAGRRALREWLTSPEPLHIELRHEGLLKFFFSDALEPEERLEQVRRMRAAHEEIATKLRAIEDAAEESDEKTCPRLTLEWGIEYHDSVADSCREMEGRVGATRAKVAG